MTLSFMPTNEETANTNTYWLGIYIPIGLCDQMDSFI